MNEDSVDKLMERYRDAEKRILEVLNHPAHSDKTQDYIKRLNFAVNRALGEVLMANGHFLDRDLKGEQEASRERTLRLLKDEPKTLTNAKVKSFLEQKGVEYRRSSIVLGTAVELSKGAQQAGIELQRRIKGIVRDLTKEGRDGVYSVADALRREFAENGLLHVTYKNGAKAELGAYSRMLARTAITETRNLSTIGATLEHGHDLVYWHAVDSPCPICARYRDKVYSISGDDKRFPYLFDTLLHPGFFTVHPNDRCSLVPWIEKLHSKAEVEQMAKQSVIPAGDPRSDRERKAYARAQAYNRQIYLEKKEYDAMKSALGEDMPYKTLGGFRRAKRADAETYAEVRREYLSLTKSDRSGIIKINQEKVDAAVRSIPDVSLHLSPVYNPRLRVQGKTTLSVDKLGRCKLVKIEIGDQTKDTEKELVDTILHEELEARIALKAYTGTTGNHDDALERLLIPKIRRYSDKDLLKLSQDQSPYSKTHQIIKAIIKDYFELGDKNGGS